VLRLVFPKAEEARPRRIQIGAGRPRTIEGQASEVREPQAAGNVSGKPAEHAHA